MNSVPAEFFEKNPFIADVLIEFVAFFRFFSIIL